jgi:dolichol kinase
MNQDITLKLFFVPLWLIALGGPMLLIGILVLISTGVIYLIRKDSQKKVLKLSLKLGEKRKYWSKAKKDTLRKLNHILIFIGLLFVWYIGLFLANIYTGTSAGMIPEENNMFKLYLRIFFEPSSISQELFSLGWFYYILFFFFYIMCLFMLLNEFARKSKKLYFPFTFFTKIYLSEKETKSYGTYLYFAIGQMFAAFACPPMVFFMILGSGSISDLMTSQIGIRFGKRKIKWNQKKTWEGTIAGTSVTLIIGFLFVGFFWSLIFSIAFLWIDVITDKPFDLSDNLLIPIAFSLIYLFIRFFFNLNYYTIIIFWM